jgi:VanZ family protein
MRLPRHPRFWFAAFFLWFVTLWALSSFTFEGPQTPPIAHLDKVEHFGFFLGGAGLLMAGFYRLNPGRPNWKRTVSAAVIIIALVGALDEWHQTHTPGRSGNDVFDWLADVLGGTTGALIFKALHQRLKWR